MSQEIQKVTAQQDTRAIARIGTMEVMPLENIKASMALVQTIVKDIMIKDTHFGTIPGTKKPTMYKPGAQLVATAFRCRPEYTDTIRDLEGGHREIVSICKLIHIVSGEYVGEGGGSCSTMESKYRYRATYEDTKKPVDRKYFDYMKANKYQEAAALSPGKGHTAKKNEDGKWTWHKSAGLQENPDIADIWNTVLKMAHKRAEVDAVISTFGLGGIFDQDMEELPEYLKEGAIDVEYSTVTTLDSSGFDEAFKEYNPDKVKAFLDLCSKSEGVTVDAVKASALEDIDGFKAALENWIKPKHTKAKKADQGKAAPQEQAPQGTGDLPLTDEEKAEIEARERAEAEAQDFGGIERLENQTDESPCSMGQLSQLEKLVKGKGKTSAELIVMLQRDLETSRIINLKYGQIPQVVEWAKATK